jgi:hypothetical protein
MYIYLYTYIYIHIYIYMYQSQQDVIELTQSNKDLSSQLQHLLKRGMDQQHGNNRPQVALIGTYMYVFILVHIYIYITDDNMFSYYG